MSVTASWVMLFFAGLFEIAWAIGLKQSNGLTRLWPTVFTLVALAASMILLALSVRTLPIGTAYAVWTGIGATGAALIGIVWFKEPATAARIVCLVLIATGIIGLKLVKA